MANQLWGIETVMSQERGKVGQQQQRQEQHQEEIASASRSRRCLIEAKGQRCAQIQCDDAGSQKMEKGSLRRPLGEPNGAGSQHERKERNCKKLISFEQICFFDDNVVLG